MENIYAVAWKMAICILIELVMFTPIRNMLENKESQMPWWQS